MSFLSCRTLLIPLTPLTVLLPFHKSSFEKVSLVAMSEQSCGLRRRCGDVERKRNREAGSPSQKILQYVIKDKVNLIIEMLDNI